jgi:hypothetical protein
VGGLEARRVHRPLDRVGQHVVVDIAVERRPAGVTGQRGRENVVAALERRQDELPRAPRVGEAVQAHERRPGAAPVEGGEGDGEFYPAPHVPSIGIFRPCDQRRCRWSG